MPAEPSIGFNISWIARMMRTRFDSRARAHGLTRAQWRLVATIRLSEGATQSEIASRLEVKTVTAGRIIDRLEAAGLIKRCADPADRRANRLYLTPAAAPMLEMLGELGADEEQVVLQGLSAQEQDTLANLLKKVVANLLDAPIPAMAPGEDEDLVEGLDSASV